VCLILWLRRQLLSCRALTAYPTSTSPPHTPQQPQWRARLLHHLTPTQNGTRGFQAAQSLGVPSRCSRVRAPKSAGCPRRYEPGRARARSGVAAFARLGQGHHPTAGSSTSSAPVALSSTPRPSPDPLPTAPSVWRMRSPLEHFRCFCTAEVKSAGRINECPSL